MRTTTTLLLITALSLTACAGGDDDATPTTMDDATNTEDAPSTNPPDETLTDEEPATDDGTATDDAPSTTAPDDEAPTTTAGDDETSAGIDTGGSPEVTPVDEATLTAAGEEGEVLLYTNAEDQQMSPIKEAFEAAYPDITLRSLPLGDEEMFQRYETETASGTSSADIVMNNDVLAWQFFIDGGNIAPYEDPNTPNLPGYAVLADGVYAASLEPVIAVFNKALLPEDQQPTTMVEMAAIAEQFDGQIGTTDISNAIQFGATAAYIDKYGDAGWETLETIAAHSSVESSSGPLVTKLAQGQYTMNFFVAGGVRAFITGDVAQVVNYSYLDDGTPLLPRAFGVTAKAPHPNAARVFVNWLLSVEGQEAACVGGFTPYRQGVECEFGLPEIIAEVGEENLTIGTFGPDILSGSAEIINRWNEAFGR